MIVKYEIEKFNRG